MLISRYPPDRGGMEIQCQRLSQALAARGHQVTVLTEASPQMSQRRYQENGVQIIRFASWGRPPWSSLWAGFRMFLHLIRTRSIDIFHAHMMATPALVALGLGRVLKKPALVKVAGAGHSGDIGTSSRFNSGPPKKRLFKKWARRIVCPSRETLTEFKKLGIAESALLEIPNGVDTRVFSPVTVEKKNDLRDRLRLPPQRLLAVYAGRWAPGKGVELLFDVWKKGLSSGSLDWDLVLLLINADKTAASFQSARAALGDRIHIFHNVSEAAPYYQTSDLAILLSEAEGLSNFLLETMACGVPSLTTAAAAVSPLSDREAWSWVAGQKVPVAEDALRQLISLQKDAAMLRVKGLSARQKIETSYSMDHVAAAYEKLYQQMRPSG